MTRKVLMLYIWFIPIKPVMEEKTSSLHLRFKYTIINEQDIIPSEDYPLFKKRKGWFRQQIVKMYISKKITTKFYICLDSDLLCIKPTTYHDLIKNGKPGINMEPKSHHSYWWDESRKVLKAEASPHTIGMSSSTNIFFTQIARDLINYIEITYEKSFIRTLVKLVLDKLIYFQGAVD